MKTCTNRDISIHLMPLNKYNSVIVKKELSSVSVPVTNRNGNEIRVNCSCQPPPSQPSLQE